MKPIGIFSTYLPHSYHNNLATYTRKFSIKSTIFATYMHSFFHKLAKNYLLKLFCSLVNKKRTHKQKHLLVSECVLAFAKLSNSPQVPAEAPATSSGTVDGASRGWGGACVRDRAPWCHTIIRWHLEFGALDGIELGSQLEVSVLLATQVWIALRHSYTGRPLVPWPTRNLWLVSRVIECF